MASLLSPLQIGPLALQNRIVLAPLTRFRADDNHVPIVDLVSEYYAQRASSLPGTLLITEGTFISPRAGGYRNVPGIYSSEQIAAWKKVTDKVHEKGGYIFCQIWALGRAADPKVLAEDGNRVVSSGNLPMDKDGVVPEALDEAGIELYIEDYVNAAKNSIAAGFDGVEIHGANGYLPDQFLQDTSNNRQDRWGGSVENRARFGIEVARAVATAIGPDRVGYRISPWSPFQGMKMADPRPQFTYLVQNLAQLNLAYLHIVEPRISGPVTIEATAEDNGFLLDAWGDAGAVILAGGFTAESARQAMKTHSHRSSRLAIAFGRHFIANPDLPFRIANGIELNAYDRSTFYIPQSPVGYVDYPFSAEFLEARA